MPRRHPRERDDQDAIGADALLRVQKYPNRRLYDRTNSRHLTNDQLHALVAEGRRVQVTDSRTGEDITNLVLAQLLLEHDPLKLAAFPPELLHLLIRSSHRVMPSVQRVMAEATAGLVRGWSEWQSWGERVAALFGSGFGAGSPPGLPATPPAGSAPGLAMGSAMGPPVPLPSFPAWLPAAFASTGHGAPPPADTPPAQARGDDAEDVSAGAPQSSGEDLRARLRRLQADMAKLEKAIGRESAPTAGGSRRRKVATRSRRSGKR